MKHPLKLSYSTKILLLTFLIILIMALLLSVSSWHICSSLFTQLETDLLGRSVESAYTQLSTATKTAQSFTDKVVRSDGLQGLLAMDDPAGEEAAPYIRQLDETIDDVLEASASSATSAIQFIGVYLKNGYQGGSISAGSLPYQSFEDCVAALEASGITELDAYVPTCWIDDVNFQGSGIYGHYLIGMRFLYNNITLERSAWLSSVSSSPACRPSSMPSTPPFIGSARTAL